MAAVASIAMCPLASSKASKEKYKVGRSFTFLSNPDLQRFFSIYDLNDTKILDVSLESLLFWTLLHEVLHGALTCRGTELSEWREHEIMQLIDNRLIE